MINWLCFKPVQKTKVTSLPLISYFSLRVYLCLTLESTNPFCFCLLGCMFNYQINNLNKLFV